MQPFNIALIMRRSGQLIGNAARVFLRACVDRQLRIIPRYVNPLGLDGCSKAPFEGVGGVKLSDNQAAFCLFVAGRKFTL